MTVSFVRSRTSPGHRADTTVFGHPFGTVGPLVPLRRAHGDRSTALPTIWARRFREEEGGIRIEIVAPGIRRDEMDVDLDGRRLVVTHRQGENGSTRVHAHVEHTLPDGLDPERATASLDLGILEIWIPRAPGAMRRRIEVRTPEAESAES